MAKDKQDPHFLGGGPKFNRAGVGASETEVVPTVAAAPAVRIRTILIAAVLIALVALLFWITNGPNGLKHVGGNGGISPTQHTPGPDSGAVP